MVSDERKRLARQALNAAVRRGEIVRPEACPLCGSTRGTMHGHHDDYARPLEVRWMCARCHNALHPGTAHFALRFGYAGAPERDDHRPQAQPHPATRTRFRWT